MLETTSDICKNLDNQRIQSKEKIKTIEGQISYWKKGVKETEENIRDMVSQRREKWHTIKFIHADISSIKGMVDPH